MGPTHAPAMKNLVLAMVLGLVCGWGVSRFLRKSDPPSARGAGPRGGRITAMVRTANDPGWPPAPDPRELDALRAAAREGHPTSPYREALFSMDLVRSLDGEALVEAFLAGQIRDELEIAEMFAKLGADDPERALDLLWEIPDRSRRSAAQNALLRVWVKRDAMGALARAAALPDTEFRNLLARDFAMEWARQDPSAALARLEELSRLSGPFGENLAESLLATWAQSDFGAAEAWVLVQPESPPRAGRLDALLLGHVAMLQAAEALDFVLDRPENAALQKHLDETLRSWAMGDPGAAVGRFAALPAHHPAWKETEALGGAAAMHQLMVAKTRDAGTVLELSQQLPEGEARNDFLLGAANTFSSNDIPAAREVVEAIPESRQRTDATGMLTELWMRQDPVALSEWLATLDPSPSRDSGVERFATLLAESDPERARQWAETIGDERERGHVLERLSEKKTGE